jgi:hypothetical protein
VYGINVLSHYINIIGIGQKLMCSIQYQSLLMAYSKAKLKSSGGKASPTPLRMRAKNNHLQLLSTVV